MGLLNACSLASMIFFEYAMLRNVMQNSGTNEAYTNGLNDLLPAETWRQNFLDFSVSLGPASYCLLALSPLLFLQRLCLVGLRDTRAQLESMYLYRRCPNPNFCVMQERNALG
ncbi:conserved hypothetical protein [Neospora caninum Liverpool]|uniref:Uncharacterized protein n=1 Tax=Neospora caninum (strain Liverpool) TaxID=572307 RepID=F0V7M2_NEOCL|nr:conserved hypothetical protein [Neospora caninum Liverpool]CBZ49713.1 conserved hypothetical protein [Neospora caninum Liverpool]CEL64298.1 TPA: hypothetical protein BN1204_002010 [Neospora caninum Liverpool]|eukprot:XP_003879748.1 conserved hypothetical protein [Neospora caninum Liverpool]